MNNMEIWNSLNRPPESALKRIGFGPLKGKSDISPQWRMKAMTEQFGPVGDGWKYEIVKLWTEPAADEQVFAFAQINLYFYKISETTSNSWSEPIPGVGGKLLLRKTKNGMESNDEAFKMAVTDAMGVAMKALGVAADIYLGRWDGSKWADAVNTNPEDPKYCTSQQYSTLVQTAGVFGQDEQELTGFVEWFRSGEKLTYAEANDLMDNYKAHHDKYSEDIPI